MQFFPFGYHRLTFTKRFLYQFKLVLAAYTTRFLIANLMSRQYWIEVFPLRLAQYTHREHYENIDAVSMEKKPVWPEPRHSRKARLPNPGIPAHPLKLTCQYRPAYFFHAFIKLVFSISVTVQINGSRALVTSPVPLKIILLILERCKFLIYSAPRIQSL